MPERFVKTFRPIINLPSDITWLPFPFPFPQTLSFPIEEGDSEMVELSDFGWRASRGVHAQTPVNSNGSGYRPCCRLKIQPRHERERENGFLVSHRNSIPSSKPAAQSHNQHVFHKRWFSGVFRRLLFYPRERETHGEHHGDQEGRECG